MTTDGVAAPARLRTLDLVLIGSTAAAMLVAVVLRLVAAVERGSLFGHHLVIGHIVAARSGAGTARPDLGTVGLANWASGASGIGVLLLATTLVVIATGPRGRQFALLVGATAVVISLAAVAAAVLSMHAVDPGTACRLGTWRTGLAAVAGACLPAVFTAAVRASAAREHH